MTQISEIEGNVKTALSMIINIQQMSAPSLQSQHIPNSYFFKQQKEKSHRPVFPGCHLFPSFLKVAKVTLYNEHTAQGPQEPLALPLPCIAGYSLLDNQLHLHRAMKCLASPLASFALISVGNPISTPTCMFPHFSHGD